MSIRKVLTWTTGLTLGAISADYLIVKKYYNVNYCPENAEHDLLGTFSHRNPTEPSLCVIDHYRTFVDLPNKDNSFNINQLANSFFSNPLFRLQTRLLDPQPTTEQQVDECKFEIGDQLSTFKVTEKNQNEIMLRSNDGFLLWMKLVQNSSSSSPSPTASTSTTTGERNHDDKQSVAQLNFGSAMMSNSPMTKAPPLIAKIELNLHFLYARYLLFFTMRQFNGKYVNKNFMKN